MPIDTTGWTILIVGFSVWAATIIGAAVALFT